MSLEHTIDQLRHLKLTGMLAGLEHQHSQSSYGTLGFDQRLGHLVDAEVSQRENQRFKRLIANARLKVFAEPEAIDYHSGRGLDRSIAADLLTCGWIERQQNVLITGHTGNRVCAACKRRDGFLQQPVPGGLERPKTTRN